MLIPAVGAAVFGALQVRVTKCDIWIDNAIFRLHYQVTTAIFVVASILTGYNMSFQPMVCAPSSLPASFVTSYCKASTHYILPQITNPTSTHNGDNKEMFSYYKWLPFVLLIQGLFFLLPYWVWSTVEGGKMERLAEGSAHSRPTQPQCRSRQQELGEYLLKTRRRNKWYAVMFYVCEVLNLAVSVGIILSFDSFVGGTFSEYGLKSVSFPDWHAQNRTDAMIEIFPRYIACLPVSFSASGTIQRHEAFCALPFNHLNEKIYCYLYCWLVFLVAMATVAVCGRILVLSSSWLRELMLSEATGLPRQRPLQKIVSSGQVGDFLLLYLLARNLDPALYRNVLLDLAACLETASKPPPMDVMYMGPPGAGGPVSTRIGNT